MGARDPFISGGSVRDGSGEACVVGVTLDEGE